jgi:hypothetical protein
MRRDLSKKADGPGRADAMKNWGFIALHGVVAAVFIFLLQHYGLNASLAVVGADLRRLRRWARLLAGQSLMFGKF